MQNENENLVIPDLHGAKQQFKKMKKEISFHFPLTECKKVKLLLVQKIEK
jgi:hypothetical protein